MAQPVEADRPGVAIAVVVPARRRCRRAALPAAACRAARCRHTTPPHSISRRGDRWSAEALRKRRHGAPPRQAGIKQVRSVSPHPRRREREPRRFAPRQPAARRLRQARARNGSGRLHRARRPPARSATIAMRGATWPCPERQIEIFGRIAGITDWPVLDQAPQGSARPRSRAHDEGFSADPASAPPV